MLENRITKIRVELLGIWHLKLSATKIILLLQIILQLGSCAMNLCLVGDLTMEETERKLDKQFLQNKLK